jgi:hypothetical protein
MDEEKLYTNEEILNGRAACNVCRGELTGGQPFIRTGIHQLVHDHQKPPANDTSWEDKTIGWRVTHLGCRG